jgi:uncharacterized protein YozE (UPF0346 family)
MGTNTLSAALLEQLRRNAKRRARENAIALHEAQNQIAVEHGFRNWSHLAKSARVPATSTRFIAAVTEPGLETGRVRHYVHGDYSENMPEHCYCAQCDIFTDINHFIPAHGEQTLERYLRDVLTWNEWHKMPECELRRPENALNALEVAAQVYVTTREKARSGFHRWLETQCDRNDPVGDLARDVFSDGNFPTSEQSVEALVDYLHDTGACREAVMTLREAFDEYELC